MRGYRSRAPSLEPEKTIVTTVFMSQKPENRQETGPVPIHRYEQYISHESRIFVNRNLKMDSIHWIGFDMDHTLALYNRNFIEALAFDLAREALIRERGYTEALRDARYDPAFGIRGLVVDKTRGNILKMDQFSYVAQAYHGKKVMDREKRKSIYSPRTLTLSDERYWTSDTLFGLPEVSLYASAVEVMENAGVEFDTWKLFDDIRHSVDLVHRDGSLKRIILERLSECFLVDPSLPGTLERFRRAGQKLFLLTNSDYAYTDKVLSYVLGSMGSKKWWEYFELIVVESHKPDFFHRRLRWKTLEPKEHDVPTFSGGNFRILEQQIGALGDRILYVGDHIFGDILRSKKASGWRTCLIVEELDHEIRATSANEEIRKKLDGLQDANGSLLQKLDVVRRRHQDLRDRKLSQYRVLNGDQLTELDRQIELSNREERELEEQLTGNLLLIKSAEERAIRRFNEYWGSLCKVDNEISLFAAQIRDYACVYTSRVSNFLHYPPDRYFRSPMEFMPHEI